MVDMSGERPVPAAELTEVVAMSAEDVGFT